VSSAAKILLVKGTGIFAWMTAYTSSARAVNFAHIRCGQLGTSTSAECLDLNGGCVCCWLLAGFNHMLLASTMRTADSGPPLSHS